MDIKEGYGVDDAGGGRRGLRATPSRELFDVLRDCYGIGIWKRVYVLDHSI